ncbi:MAG: DUF5979 domain-containing protein, partial [Corynebacterium sp.]|nr:DUF5979 domain-containing protein [Corynebacterium sp.]
KAGESATSKKIPAEFSCTVTELNADVEDATLVTTGLDTTLTIVKDGDPKDGPLSVTNNYSQWKGTLEISKRIAGTDTVVQSVGDREFDVSYVCVKNGKTTNEGELKVRAGQTAEIQGIVANAECTVTEKLASAEIDNLDFVPRNSILEINSIPVTADGGRGTAELVNAYLELGKFAVVKRVDGVRGGTGDKEFTFNYTCGADVGVIVARGDGKPVEVDKTFPVGTECTVTEDADSAAVVDHADVTVAAERVKKVVVAPGQLVAAEFTNVYSRDMGKFKVSKKLVADAELKVPGEFKVDYRCTKDGEEDKTGTLTVPANGSVDSEEMPTGYACSVVGEHDALVPGATLVTDLGSGVEIAKGNVPVIEVSNTYTKNFGDFTITKTVVDPDNVAEGKEFEFRYVCTPPEARKDEKPVEGTLKVKAGESATSKKIPAEFSCTITEVGAEIMDSNLTTTGLDTKLVIATDKNGKVEVENKYSQWRGSLNISKAIVGTDAVAKIADGHEFDLSVKCMKNGKVTNEDRVKVKAGTTATVNNIVANSSCTVEENMDTVEIKNLRFLGDSSDTRIDAPKVTADGGVAEVTVRNAYVELGTFIFTKEVNGLTGNAGDANREFHIVASWIDNGKHEEKEFAVRAGEVVKDFPALPVGTKVTLKEKHPGDNILQHWNTPAFSSDRLGAVVDNRDGTAVLTIVSGTPADLPLMVKLTNSANPPWWWLAIPGALLLRAGDPGSSNGSGNTGTGTPGIAAPLGEKQTAAHTGTAPASGESFAAKTAATLARTGASVLSILTLAGVVTAAGIYLVRRNRNKS